MEKDNLVRSILAGLFSAITIGALTYLTYKTTLGLFLIASFGSSMVLLYGYPESPFAQPKNIFFGHLLTALVGVIISNFVPLPIFLTIPIAVGFGVAAMIFLNVTHPPAGGNPIIVIIGSVTVDYLINPIIIGSIIILIFGVILNWVILKACYTLISWIFTLTSELLIWQMLSFYRSSRYGLYKDLLSSSRYFKLVCGAGNDDKEEIFE